MDDAMKQNVIKILLFAGIMGGLYFVFTNFFTDEDLSDISDTIDQVVDKDEDGGDTPPAPSDDTDTEDKGGEVLEDLENYLPKSQTAEDVVVGHRFFTLSYSEKDEQARWVAYELSRQDLMNPVAERTDNFRLDKTVPTGSASTRDYRGTGYDRGHLCAAADMAHSRTAMSETFYMSNMSPQEKSFNRGVWKELEEQVRDWAKANKHLYVITGPVLRKRESKKIGENKVSVPKAYYKALLDLKQPEQKAIAFLIPNEKQTSPLSDFAMSIDELEALVGIDFFPELPDELEEKVESTFNESRWMYDEERYQTRLSQWNQGYGSAEY